MTLRPLDQDTFEELAIRHPYFRGRWVYLQHVAAIVEQIAPQSVLEVGVGPHQFVPGSDTLDAAQKFNPTFHHDAGAMPWPIESGSYDLVIGLQCWEHFKGRQALAFLEAVRVAGPRGHVLLSFPYKWTNTDARHSRIGPGRIREWTVGAVPDLRVLVEEPPTRRRLVMLFRGGELRPTQQ